MDQQAVRHQWADRDGEYSPAYYAYHGPNDRSETVRAALDQHVGRDAPVLEIGCSAGRHLANLQRHGYTDLTGIEINPDARDVLRRTYPELARAGTFHFEPVESVIDGFASDAFAATFTVETLQHVHPDAAWVFEEIARVTETLLVIVESEPVGDGPELTHVNDEVPLYRRDWADVFGADGFETVAVDHTDRNTAWTLRAA